MTEGFSKTQVIELFHVAFLDVLSRRLDQRRYALKGGANLRYFFGSLRYSEDIDLDVQGEPSWRLREKVDGILGGPGPLNVLLRSAGLTLSTANAQKQTETTQRWKIEIAHGRGVVRTKIEFSHRNGDRRYRLEAIPDRVVAPYALRSPTVQHYVDDAPTEQKVAALALRSHTQARDVFDLDLLLRRRPLAPGSVEEDLLARAADYALQLPFDAFRDQVLPFLEPEAVELYEGEEAWESMQTFVAEKLEEAR